MNENIKFSELAKWYYDQVAVHKLKPLTYANNRNLMDLYVLPFIGNMKLKEINTARIDALLNQLHRDGRKKETYRLRDTATLEKGTRRPLVRKSGVNMNTLRELAMSAERIWADRMPVKAHYQPNWSAAIAAATLDPRSGIPITSIAV